MQQFSTPSWIRLIAALIGLACAITALPLVLVGFAGSAWHYLAFQLVVALSGAFSVLLLLGRLAEAPAMAIACVAGTVFLAAVLGEPALAARLIGTPAPALVVRDVLGTGINVPILPVAVAQLAAAIVLFMLAGLAVVSRRPARSVRYLAWSAAWGLPIVLVAAVMLVPGIRQQVAAVNAYVGTAAAVLGLFVGITLASGCGHCFIRAMETGSADDEAPAT